MAPPAYNRKRRSSDPESIHLHRVLSSPQAPAAGAGFGARQVSSMNRNSSPASPSSLQQQEPRDFPASNATSADFNSNDELPSALATLWMVMMGCVAPLHGVLLPEARHILTCAIRLMNEDIGPLLLQKVQQAIAVCAPASTSESPAPEMDASLASAPPQEAMPFTVSRSMGNMSSKSRSDGSAMEEPSGSTTVSSESMDWELEPHDSRLAKP